jgi:hypothetical protein
MLDFARYIISPECGENKNDIKHASAEPSFFLWAKEIRPEYLKKMGVTPINLSIYDLLRYGMGPHRKLWVYSKICLINFVTRSICHYFDFSLNHVKKGILC